MSKYPETIRLFLELTGQKLFFWEPVDGSNLFLVELTDGTQHWVVNNRGEISHWENKCPQ
jgi:hypothetical protein